MDSSLDLQYQRLLGEGSYGKVFLVKQQDGQQFAVKEIDLTKCDESGRDQAHGEANLLSRIKQDNILLYVETVICEECLYIVTEYCEGGDLEDYLQVVSKKGASIPESLVSEWILQLGGALKYLHDQKILHRDMKTKNIFLKDDLTVKLGDLGIAKVLDLNQSKADTFVGTPSYMSPELFSGKSYNHKTDIWGLGCCAYEMMTMKRAFQGKALWTLIREIKNGRVLNLPDSYSLEIRTLVQEMMAKNPEDRPSAKEIVLNDLLTYHTGSAHDDVIKTLPRPHEHVEKKPRSRASRAIGGSGSGSGSLLQVLQQMNQSQEKKFKDTIESVCEKINTLRMSQKGTMNDEDCDTFVYKGSDSESEEELEAAGTILDKSLLKQYTEQLDTFVFKGEGILDSDSDYSTGGSVKKHKDSKEDVEDDADDLSQTLLRQYSETLEEDEEVEEEEKGSGVEGNGLGGDDSGFGYSNNTEVQDHLEESLVSKYKYKGLKDTFALRPNKRWSKHPNDSRDLFSPHRIEEEKSSKKHGKHGKRSESGNSKKSPGTPKGVSLSASMSSTDSINASRQKVTDPRLNRTLSLENKSSNSKTVRMKTCDRIEQSAKSRAVRQDSPKKAFVDIDPVLSDDYADEPDVNVKDVISHLHENISPYASVDSQSETIRSPSSDSVSQSQELSPSKGKKKKTNFLKKQSEAKKQDTETAQENGSGNKNVQLFTRAQSARFSKSNSTDEDDSVVISDENDKTSIQDIISCIQRGCSDTLRNEQILIVQHELTAGVGYDNLRKVLDIMSMIRDEQEMQMHITHVLGPKLYEEYKNHLTVLRLLEGQGSSFI